MIFSPNKFPNACTAVISFFGWFQADAKPLVSIPKSIEPFFENHCFDCHDADTAKDPMDPNGGTLFDNSLVYCGGGLRTAHRNTNVPCLLTGGGFKGLTHGQHRFAPNKDTPLANLWTTMLQDAGAGVDRFADANATAHSIWG